MENPSGIAALGINWRFFISQVVNFLLLVLLLRWLLYKPVTKMLDDRRKKIADTQALAEKYIREAQESEIKNKEILDKAKEDAKKILEDMKEQAQEEAKKIKGDSETEAKRILERNQREIEQDRLKMIKSLENELAELVLLASGKLTKKSIKPEVQKTLVGDVLEDLKNKKF